MSLRLTDAEGVCFYVRDEDSGASGPLLSPAEGIEAELEEVTAPDAAELRRVRLRNTSGRTRRLSLTSYAGIVLNDAAAHAAHPGFSKLFIQTRLDATDDVLLARRRPRGSEPAPPELAHALLGPGAASFETDRARFVGRGRSLARPAALEPGAGLTGTLGNVLDPIASWRRSVSLAPGESAEWISVLALGLTGAETAACAHTHAQGTGGAVLRTAAPATEAARYAPSELAHASAPAPAPRAEALRFDNGFGGFSPGRPRVRDPHPRRARRAAPAAHAVDQRDRERALRLPRDARAAPRTPGAATAASTA